MDINVSTVSNNGGKKIKRIRGLQNNYVLIKQRTAISIFNANTANTY